jgi:hypothetical protein
VPNDVILAVYAAVVAITVIRWRRAAPPASCCTSRSSQYVTGDAWDDQIAAGVMLFRGFQWFLVIPVSPSAAHRRSVSRHMAAGDGQPAQASRRRRRDRQDHEFTDSRSA